MSTLSERRQDQEQIPRRWMSDDAAISERVKSDIAAVFIINTSVSVDDLIRLGWTFGQIDAWRARENEKGTG